MKNISSIAKSVQKTLAKYSPEILTGLGVAGMVTTTILAVKATPKAIKLIEEETEKKKDKQHSKQFTVSLTPVETVKVAWKPYIPAALSGTVAICCVVGASATNHKRNAVLATAYSLSEKALFDYRDKVVETVGEKKEQLIRDKVAQEKVSKIKSEERDVVITGKGDMLCLDTVSGQLFRSDIDKIRQAEKALNKRLVTENYISLNEFYYELGLRQSKLGNELGWNIEDGWIDLSLSSALTDDQSPCLVIDYLVGPRYSYQELR